MLFSSADAAFPAALTTQALNLVRHASHHHDSSTKEIRAPPPTPPPALPCSARRKYQPGLRRRTKIDWTLLRSMGREQEEQEEGVSARGSG